MNPKIIVSGAKGSGKTTLVKRVIDGVASLKIAGFYCEEVPGKKGKPEIMLKTLEEKDIGGKLRNAN